MPNLPKRPGVRRTAGFSLVELTIVLVIVALLSGGLLLNLSGQQSQAQNKEAQQQLDLVRDALLGFAMSNGRLPCPANPGLATDSGGGREAWTCTPADCSGDRTCTLEHGTIPWLALGLKEGDPWGTRLTYFVGREFANPLSQAETTAGLRARFTLDTVGRAYVQDGLGHDIAREIPAVVVSHGSRNAGGYLANGAQQAGANGDEAENADADLLFISRSPNDTFDDLVTWIVPTVLKARLVAVGKLP